MTYFYTHLHTYTRVTEYDSSLVLLYAHTDILLQNACAALRDNFNKQFNAMYALKEREMFLVTERNTRLRYILSETNNTWTEITDPEWSQKEQPEKIMEVEDYEVQTKHYKLQDTNILEL